MRILGIDPGSNITGFGVINAQQLKLSYQASGCVKTKGTTHEKIGILFTGIEEVLKIYTPEIVVLERIFMRPDRPNPEATIKLAQARGAIIAAINQQNLPIVEYTANQIKKTTVGRGHANKEQVSFMVQQLLKLEKAPQIDAADALAGAICHAYHSL